MSFDISMVGFVIKSVEDMQQLTIVKKDYNNKTANYNKPILSFITISVMLMTIIRVNFSQNIFSKLEGNSCLQRRPQQATKMESCYCKALYLRYLGAPGFTYLLTVNLKLN